MIRYCFTLCIFFCTLVTLAQKNHVVLISIDGLRPEFYSDKAYPTPNLQKLMQEGSYAHHMKSVFPSLTYPSHTAMITGALPMRSGIAYNVKLESKDWYWHTKDIKVPTLWSVLKSNNKTTAAIQWPVTAGNDITYNLPEIWDHAHPEDRITVPRTYSAPGLIEDIESNATGKLTPQNMNEEFETLDINSARIAAYIFTKYKPDLLAVHFLRADGVQHSTGRDSEATMRAAAHTDHCVSMVLEAIERSGLKDSTTVIIVGDHGLMDMHAAVRPNTLIKDLPAKFYPAGGSAFLYLKDTQDKKTLKEIEKRLSKYTQGDSTLFRIIDRDELDNMGADANASLALAATPHYIMSGATEGKITSLIKSGAHHGCDPNVPEMHTGFIAAGYNIRQGVVIPGMTVTDIAPLVAKLLGIDFKTPDGKLQTGILK